MKKTILTVLVVAFGLNLAKGQLTTIKKFDYSLLKNKVLYIPKWSSNSDYAKKLIKKGKFDKLKTEKERVEEHNKLWTEAMAQSSYDATPYEIRAFDHKKLFKEKNNKAIVLFYYRDQYYNWFVQMWVAGPKKRMIANALINDLDLSKVEDVRLMINMLNFTLNTAMELEEEGSSKSYSEQRSKYKENLIQFFERMPEMTFLVPKDKHKNPKKAMNRNNDLKAALKGWKLSNYEFTTEEEVEKRRLEGDPESFYWRNFSFYTQSPLITYRVNYILTTEKDEVVFYFMGTKRLKPSTLMEIQNKIKKRALRFKEQVSN